MAIIFKEIPKGLDRLFKPYKKGLTKPQYSHFKTLVFGLIANDKKTIQEINDALSDKNQSSLNRFVTKSRWDLKKINDIRIKQGKSILSRGGDNLFIIDDMLCHKHGKKMEKANYHRSGKTKKKEWGHPIVDSLCCNHKKEVLSIKSDIYVRKEDIEKGEIFKTKRDLALEQMDLAIERNVPFNTSCADSWYYGVKFIKEIKQRGKHYLIGVKISVKISIGRKKRISIAEHLDTLTDDNFEPYEINGEWYFIYVKEVSIRGLGKTRLIISFKHGDEETIKCYVTDREDDNEKLMNLLVLRWNIEVFHRDTKQHLGLEKYQVRKYRGIQVVVLAVLVAYTLLLLSLKKLKVFTYVEQFFKRGLKTIGEICRFMQLAAQKGWRWITTKLRDPVEARKILKKYVFVKNAKV
jgi:SRSO17 transposase